MNTNQDWNVVVFKKRATPPPALSSFKTHEQAQVQKLEAAEPAALQYVSYELAKAITSARTATNMTQDHLAKKACLNLAIVREIEQAKAVYNPANIVKICKCLNLNTKDIKKRR